MGAKLMFEEHINQNSIKLVNTYCEIFNAQASKNNFTLQANKPVNKIIDKEIKSYVISAENEFSNIILNGPFDINQHYLVLQTFIYENTKIELRLTDGSIILMRLIASKTQPNPQLNNSNFSPLNQNIFLKWINLVFDLQILHNYYTNNKNALLFLEVEIAGKGKLRRAFTVNTFNAFDIDEMIPKHYALSQDAKCSTQMISFIVEKIETKTLSERRTVSAKEHLITKDISDIDIRRPAYESSHSMVEETSICPQPPKKPASHNFQRKIKNKIYTDNDKCPSLNRQTSEKDSLYSDEASSLDSLNELDCRKLYTFSSRPRPTRKAILDFSKIISFRENNKNHLSATNSVYQSPRLKHLDSLNLKSGKSPRIFLKNVTRNSIKEVMVENLQKNDKYSEVIESFERRMLLSIQRESAEHNKDEEEDGENILDEATFSDYSDDESTARSTNSPLKNVNHDYEEEMEFLGRGFLSQLTLTPRDESKINMQNVNTNNELIDNDEKLELFYDYQLHLFFDTRTGKYYQLNTMF